ncbi:hypothetical protein [Streptacidiphilus sp. PAMC 29251]
MHGHNLHHFTDAPAHALLRLREERRQRQELDLVLLHTYHSVWQEQGHPAADAVKQWDGHFAVSDFLSQDCRRVLDVAAKRTYLGIDTARFLAVPPLSSAEPGTVLLPARLIPDKGAELAIEAIAHIVDSGLCPGVEPKLLLTATPDCVDFHHEKDGFRAKLNKLIAERGLATRVDFKQAGWPTCPASTPGPRW